MLLKPINGLLLVICSTFCISASAASLRDPTLPGSGVIVASNSAASVSKTMTLNSVVVKHNSAFAVINGQIYKQGQRVNGVKIMKIDEDTVSLADGRKLKMFEAIIEIKGQ
ncbi:MSHA biogenesis protein MshK [Shewanella youngdeokensis]|uniref:MSHA biogenesis protein MshK n=1 Tax=Shewanella youngdeokensis TaxID=2999068 RepID=A0ABZ0JWW9_9GAMM|nr:MSHA biogenesis protein MshK [Shewanella sp. DAU334]